jgi:hypothetical protein
MTDPGYPPPATPPATTPPPYAPGLSGADAAAAPAPSRAKKVLGVVGSVVVAGVAAASWFGLGASTPEVGDCVAAEGDASFDVVDCGGDDAEHRVVGIEPEEMTYEAYMADDGLCAGFDTAQMVLWVGEEGSDGTVLCAEPA